MNPKITVITCTNRWGGADIWKESLKKQTFTEFEALFVDEKHADRKTEVSDYISDDTRLKYIQAPPKDESKFWNLSKSLNYALSIARGELLVFYQDYIWLPQNGLELFWKRYQSVGDCLISGIGNKARQPNWAINLYGKVTIFTQSGIPGIVSHEFDKPEDAIDRPKGVWFVDPRMINRPPVFQDRIPMDWEANWCSCPLKVAQQINGFDEDFDAGWGFDNVNFAERAELAGYKTYLDPENECVGFSHEILFKENEKKSQDPNNGNLYGEKHKQLYELKENPEIANSYPLGLASAV